MKNNNEGNAKRMRTPLSGRLLLSLVLLTTIGMVIGFQWNTTHVFNPEWHPHARFHAVQLTGFIVVLSLIGFWLIWRRSAESNISARIAVAIPLIFWSGEFYALLVPGTSPAFDLNNPNTFELAGVSVYGNLFLSGVLIVLSILSYWLISRNK